MTNRECGNCEVCCITPAIEDPSLNKPAGVVCPHLNQSKSKHKCMIYADRPMAYCGTFFCSWMMGFGNEEDQPSKNGLLTNINTFNNGRWITAIEFKPNALISGKNIIIDLIKKHETAVIVQLFDSSIETGDWTVIKNSLLNRATAMTGDFIYWLDEEQTIGVYVLINPLADK